MMSICVAGDSGIHFPHQHIHWQW